MPIRLSGINSGLDTDAIVKELVSAYSLKTQKYEKEQTKIEWKQEAWKSLNTKIYGLYTNISNLRLDSAYNLKRTSTSDPTKASVTASSDAVAGTQKLNIIKTAQTSYMTGAYLGEDVKRATKLKDLGIEDGTIIKVKSKDGTEEAIELKAEMSIAELTKEFTDKGLRANFDENNNRFYISAKDSGEASDFEIIADDQSGNDAIMALGLAIKEDAGEESHKYATKITGQDAIIKLNNVVYTNTSNTFSINGLSIDAHTETGDGDNNAIIISTTVDTQGIYDKIKDFLTEYNNVINEMTKLYNAESAGDYEPLTDEERESMSDEQIEKWEGKIKSALLRRDSSLSSVMNAMVNSMAQGVEVNGEKLTLSSFGIQTLGFLNAAENEQYAYHIDGDPDDESKSGKSDKLMKAIQEDPDKIMGFMKELTSKLYTAIDSKMKSTELSSAYKVYNDKELDSQLDKYKKLIAQWEKKVAEEEDRYYKQFSNMEVALSKLQNQTNALGGLLGQ